MFKPLPDRVGIKFQGGLYEAVTPHAGVSLLIEVGRKSGVIATAERCLPAKRSPKGLTQGQFVEAFVTLIALGGECVDDLDLLRKDQGLAHILGYQLPAASTGRQWLEPFHDAKLLEGRPAQGSFIPEESPRLAALGSVRDRTVHAYAAACRPGRKVTLDIDAHLVQSSKSTAFMTYEGYRGYQPLLVVWAETGLIVADQFRDGNVPASVNIKGLIDCAYHSLPVREDGYEIWIRSDSAGYEYKALDHWDEQGWKFAVSADISPQLREHIESLPPDEWHSWTTEGDGAVKEWAEVPFVPCRQNEHRNTQPYRYVAVRIRKAQGTLFGDGSTVKLFAVVTNEWQMDGLALLKWHRGKAGTIEHAHRVVKDELAGGVYPSAKFGVNVCWLRLQVITNNLLELMKATALDEQYRKARPKRLRFAIFTQMGAVVHHARKVFMRVTRWALKFIIQPGLQRIAMQAWNTC